MCCFLANLHSPHIIASLYLECLLSLSLSLSLLLSLSLSLSLPPVSRPTCSSTLSHSISHSNTRLSLLLYGPPPLGVHPAPWQEPHGLAQISTTGGLGTASASASGTASASAPGTASASLLTLFLIVQSGPWQDPHGTSQISTGILASASRLMEHPSPRQDPHGLPQTSTGGKAAGAASIAVRKGSEAMRKVEGFIVVERGGCG
jgi:hypothetical protein